MKTDWSARRVYPKTDIESFHRKTIATIAAISSEKGVEVVMNFDKSVNKECFVRFLKKLRQVNPYRRLALFMDRLSVHRTKVVKDEAEKLQLMLIFNASYSPDYNPIEGVIGLAKDYIRRKRWQNVQDNI